MEHIDNPLGELKTYLFSWGAEQGASKQRGIARALGVGLSKLSQWLQEKRFPGPKHRQQLVKAGVCSDQEMERIFKAYRAHVAAQLRRVARPTQTNDLVVALRKEIIRRANRLHLHLITVPSTDWSETERRAEIFARSLIEITQ